MRLFLKVVGIILAALIVLVAAFIFSPSLQRKTALWALKESGAKQVALEEVYISFKTMKLRDLVIEHESASLRIAKVDVQWSPWGIFSGNGIHFKAIDGSGIKLTIPQGRTPTKTAQVPQGPYYFAGVAMPEHFSGLFEYLELPTALTVDHIQLDATLQLPEAAPISLRLSGGNLAPQKEGTFEVIGNCNNLLINTKRPLPLAAQTTLKVREGKKNIEALNVAGAINVRGKALNGSVSLEKQADFEQYKALLTPEKGQALCEFNGRFMPKAKRLEATLQLDADQERIGPIFDIARAFLGNQFKLPQFSIKGSCSASGNPLEGPLSLKFSGTTHLEDLGSCLPALQALRQLDGKMELEADVQPKWIEVSQLNLHVTDSNQRSLIEVKLSHPIRYEAPSTLKTNALGTFLSISLDCPLRYLTPLATLCLPEYAFSGNSLQGSVLLESIENGKLRWKTPNPLSVIGLTAARGKDKLVSNLTLKVASEGTFDSSHIPFDLSVGIEDETAQSLLKDTITGELECNHLELKHITIKGHPEVNFKALSQQPYLVSCIGLELPYRLQGEYEASATPNRKIELQTLQLRLYDNNTIAARLALTKPLAVEIPFSLSKLSGDLLEAELDSIPLAFANPFLGNYAITTGNVSGSFQFKAHQPQGIIIDADKPFQVKNFSLQSGSTAFLQSLNLEMRPYLTFNPDVQTGAVILKGIKLTNGAETASWAEAEVSLDVSKQFPFLQRADSDLKIDFNGLGKQPAFKGLQAINGSTHVSLKLNEKEQFTAKGDLTANSLTDATKSFAARFQATGTVGNKTHLEFPIEWEGPAGKSDLTGKLSLSINKDNHRFDVTLDSKAIFLDDALAIASLFKPAAEQPKAAATTPAASPSEAPKSVKETPVANKQEPLWAGWTGSATGNFKSILFRGERVAEDLKVSLSLDEKSASQSTLGRVFGAQLDEHYTTHYLDKGIYHHTADVKCQPVDVSKVLKVVAPDKAGMLSGAFAVSLKGETEGKLEKDSIIEGLRGQINVTGTEGLLAPLSSNTEAIVDIGSSLLGAVLKPLAGTTAAVSYFKKIPFHTLSCDIQRGKDKDVLIKKLLLRNDEMNLEAHGQIKHVNNLAIEAQPLAIEAQLNGLGQCAELLSSLHRLEKIKDSQGYYHGPSFSIGGTCKDPKYKQIIEVFTTPGNEPDWMHPESQQTEASPIQNIINLF